MNFKRIIQILALSIFTFGFQRLLQIVGFTADLPTFPETNECTYHKNDHVGPEDPVKITENIFIAGSNDNVAMWDMVEGMKVTPPGYLFIYYLDTEVSKKVEIQNKPSNFVFQPHGVYYDYENKTLFVINHPYEGKGDRIEEFVIDLEDLENIKVTYTRSYQLPAHLNGVTNALIQIKNGEFIVTQWLVSPDGLTDSSRNSLQGKLNKLKMLSGIYVGQENTNIYSCLPIQKQENQINDLNCIVIEGGQAGMNNGITWNYVDTVLVANTATNLINVFKVDMNAPREKRLVKQQSIETTRHTDNVKYDVYLKQYTTGGIGKMYQYFQYVKEQIKVHPVYRKDVGEFWSFVDIIKYDEKSQQFDVENVLLRPDVYRGCASSIQYKNKIYMGSWCDKSVGICPLKGSNPKKPRILTLIEWIQQKYF